MNIEELIKELSAFNPKAEITTPYSETIRLSWICDDGDIINSKKNTELVFIEGCDLIEEDKDRSI